MIELSQPDLGGNEASYVAEAMASGWISSHGKYIGLFEEAFAQIAGTRHAIATNNGTTALHLALTALGIGQGDEVIVPTVTYVATANAVRYCSAEPVLVDVEPETLNIDVEAVRAAITPRTKAVIAVHLYGIPADVQALRRLCDEHSLLLVEDAAEAHGALVGDRPVGGFGDASIFSFFGNKIMTTGEGGMVVTDDDDLARRLKLLRGQGQDPDRRYWFPVVGFNYRMTNIEAALGLAQTERFPQLLAQRRTLAGAYREALRPLADRLQVIDPPPGTTPVPWLQNVYLRAGGDHERGATIDNLRANGVDSRPVFYPMHVLPPYRSSAPFPVADLWSARGLSLPLHTAMTHDDVATVARALERSLPAA